jgi:effector-binding domain-containing protein
MKTGMRIAMAVLVGGSVRVMATEEAAYKEVRKDAPFEVRDYESCLLAETRVDGSFEDAGNAAFRRLFKYISGANRQQEKIAMTAPVGQQSAGRKIAMTAPVGQRASSNQWAVSFMMPSGFTPETLPLPTDPAVTIREVPAQRVAVVRYGGTWSDERYRRHLKALEEWLAKNGLQATGEPVWARYNPPFTPWFLRRNEIHIPVRE